MEKDWRTTIKVMILVTFGTMLFSFGVNSFIVPHKLVSGGISGIALMLYYLTGIQIGTLNLILNIPILYAAYRWLGHWHLMITIFGTVVSSFMINAFSFMNVYHLTTDPLVGAILGRDFYRSRHGDYLSVRR